MKEEEHMVEHTCSIYCSSYQVLLPQLPNGQLAAINEQAGKEGNLSGEGWLQLKSHTVFLGNPFWAWLPSRNLLGHISSFISYVGTESHPLLHFQAGYNNDYPQPPQCHLWSAPSKFHSIPSNLYLSSHI